MRKRRQIDMTDPWVRNVRTNKPREEWRDAKQPNLELRVTVRGAKTWHLHYTRADGRRKATRLGRYSSDGVSGGLSRKISFSLIRVAVSKSPCRWKLRVMLSLMSTSSRYSG